MAITLPSDYPGINLADYVRGERGDSADWTDVVQALHWLWSRRRTRVCGIDWYAYDDPWQTTSLTATVDNNNTNGPHLDQWQPLIEIRREAEGGAYYLGVQFYGADISIDVDLIDLGTGSSVASTTVDRSSTSDGWDETEWSPSVDPGLYQLQIQAHAIATEATLYQLSIDELLITTAARLPR